MSSPKPSEFEQLLADPALRNTYETYNDWTRNFMEEHTSKILREKEKCFHQLMAGHDPPSDEQGNRFAAVQAVAQVMIQVHRLKEAEKARLLETMQPPSKSPEFEQMLADPYLCAEYERAGDWLKQVMEEHAAKIVRDKKEFLDHIRAGPNPPSDEEGNRIAAVLALADRVDRVTGLKPENAGLFDDIPAYVDHDLIYDVILGGVACDIRDVPRDDCPLLEFDNLQID
jgi:predicted glycosyl hydrolase (DUF1957 family)